MKEQIITTLLMILSTQGLKFTMNDLVRELRISKSTLYNHFSSKEELLEEMVDYILQKLDEEANQIVNSEAPLEDKLYTTVRVYSHDLGVFQNHVYQYLYSIPAINKKVMAYNKRRFDHFNQLLDEGVKAGLISTNVKRGVFLQLLLLAQRGFIDPQILSQLNITYGDAVDESIRILLHGIFKTEAK